MASNTGMKTFRHAISLDEHRSKFNVNLWNRLPKDVDDPGTDTQDARIKALQKLQIIEDEPTSSNCHTAEYTLRTQYDRTRDCLEMMLSNRNAEPTNVEEVWFAVCICQYFRCEFVLSHRLPPTGLPLR